MRSILSRFGDLLLLLIALGPLVVVIACFVAAAVEVIGTTKLVIRRAEPIVQAVQTQITPVARRIEGQAAARDQGGLTLAAPKDIGTLRIETGQLGQTPTLRVRLPSEDRTFGALRDRAAVLVAMHTPLGHATDAGPDDAVRLAFGIDIPKPKLPDIPKPSLPDLPKMPDLPKLKIDAGSILDRELPSFPMPPAPVAAELPAVRQLRARHGRQSTRRGARLLRPRPAGRHRRDPSPARRRAAGRPPPRGGLDAPRRGDLGIARRAAALHVF